MTLALSLPTKKFLSKEGEPGVDVRSLGVPSYS